MAARGLTDSVQQCPAGSPDSVGVRRYHGCHNLTMSLKKTYITSLFGALTGGLILLGLLAGFLPRLMPRMMQRMMRKMEASGVEIPDACREMMRQG